MFNRIKLPLVALLLFLATQAHSREVSVLVLYTEAAKSAVPHGSIEDRIDSYIDSSNDSYETSGIDIQLKLAAAHLVPGVDDSYYYDYGIKDYVQHYSTNDALSDLKAGRGVFSEAHYLRNRYGADFVVLLRDIQDTGGLGYITVSPKYAFSVVRIRNGLTTFTHELGHNMGLAHSRRQVRNGEVSGSRHYAAGHGVDSSNGENGFVTIMAYSSEFNYAREIAVISNPNIGCNSGTSTRPCGVDASDRYAGADGSLVLNNAKNIYADYRSGPMVSTLKFSDTNLQNCMDYYGSELINGLHNLSCTSQAINDINGIEQLEALHYADLQGNELVNIDPLLELPNLESAVLTGNDSIVCSGLDQLEEKLGANKVIRPDSCYPAAALLVSNTINILY